MTIIEKVTNLYEREQRIRKLCLFVLATLRLKDNQPFLTPKLKYFTDEWQTQLDNIIDFYPIE